MKKIFYGFMILALFSACKKKGNDEPQVPVPTEVTITASMGQMTGGATDDKSSTFEVGDCIMVYGWTGSASTVPANPPIAAENTLRLQNKVESWKAEKPMRWQNQTDKHYFLGICPARKVTDFTADLFVVDPNNPKASDLLVAVSPGVTATFNPVALAFDHLLAKLVVDVCFGTQFDTPPAIDAMTLYCGKEAKVNYLKRSVAAERYRFDASKTQQLPLVTTTNPNYASIVVPQAGVRRIDIRYNGTTQTYESDSDIPLESGKITTLNLTVGKDKIEADEMSVIDWIEDDDVILGTH